MRRSEIREHVFMLLFRVNFHEGDDVMEQVRLYLDTLEADEKSKNIILGRYSGVMEHLLEVDSKISELSSGWKIERIGKVELSIIRLAVFEIFFDDDVPNSVAINEAVELAKKFGGDDSPSFVNGVLGKVTRQV